MVQGVTTAGVLLGLVLGIPTGMAVQYMRRAFADLRKTQAAIPGLRKDAWRSARKVAKFVVAIAVLALVLLTWMIRGVEEPARETVPAKAPTTVPARPGR